VPHVGDSLPFSDQVKNEWGCISTLPISLCGSDSDNFNVYLLVNVPIEIRTKHLPPLTLQQPACVFVIRIQFHNYCIVGFSFCLMTLSLLRLFVFSGQLPHPGTVWVLHNYVMKRKGLMWRNSNTWTLKDDIWSWNRINVRNDQGHHIEIMTIITRIQFEIPKYCSYYMHRMTQHKMFSLCLIARTNMDWSF